MSLAKATPEDFRIMWKVSKAHQNLAWAHNRQRELRLKMLIIGRLEQLGTGGFMRIVMGAETLIDQCCDARVDFLAFKPVYGAAPELLEALKAMLARFGGAGDKPAPAEVLAHAAIAHSMGVLQ